MASIATKQVAEEVLATIGRQKIPKIEKIALKKGYAKTTARAGLVQKTKTFQKIVGNALDSFQQERQAIFEEMKKKRKKAPYSSLVSGLDTTSKNIQLLSGGATENIAIGVKKLKDSELQALAEGK